MINYWAPQCSHNSVRESCFFFRFPTDVTLRNSWASLVRRADSIPSNNSRLCSCHFKNGLKGNSPSIFAWNENKIMHFVSPEKHKRTKTVRCNVEEQYDNTAASGSIINKESNTESADLIVEENTILEKNVECYFLKKENEDLKK
ncbi:uncharacterized protein LOC126553451 [Aphis gossypii]|uniref:uncharacterized protein LOC126553451 n=1 Tax=Aphis gossypii TaxID=80765 RepID=UPI002158EF7B|nr:uncharacterized protein LOC126553451 [Aphis gossypii]